MVGKVHEILKEEHRQIVKLAAETAASKTKQAAKTIKEETKKQTATAVISAFALLIALTWKDVIQGLVMNITSDLLNSSQSPFIQLYATIITTIICVIGIIMVNKWLSK